MRSLTFITGLCSGILVFGLASIELVNAQTSPSLQINAPLQDGNGNRFFPKSGSELESDFEFEGKNFEYSPQHDLAIYQSSKVVIDGKLDQKQLNKFINHQLPKSDSLIFREIKINLD